MAYGPYFMADEMALPTPTLHHCAIGSRIKLAHDSKERVIVHKCGSYAYFDNYQASLCCQVVAECMEFGEGGWRVRQ